MMKTELKFMLRAPEIKRRSPTNISVLRKMLISKMKTVNLSVVELPLLLVWVNLKETDGRSHR